MIHRDTCYHITPIENLEAILKEGLKTNRDFWAVCYQNIYLGDTPRACLNYFMRREVKPICALLMVDTRGIDLKETFLTYNQCGAELRCTQDIEPERLSLVGIIDHSKQVLHLADATIPYELEEYDIWQIKASE